MASRTTGSTTGSTTGTTTVGRYVLEGEVASGGMATIYYGRRTDAPHITVAIKRVHPHLAKDKKFASMFIDEARVVSRIQHPNVIRTLDIIATEDECMLVMEYVHGESLMRLIRAAAAKDIPARVDIVSAVVCGALRGLHAAHEATNAAGAPLQLVHRDVSPHNVIVGADGVPRVLDFGVAKAHGSLHQTKEGEIKGKLAYMAPEQLAAEKLDRRTDIYAMGIVLWESLTQRPLFDGDSEAAVIASVLRAEVHPPSQVVPGLPPALDRVVLRALLKDKKFRYPNAAEMADALEASVPRATEAEVAQWVLNIAGADLAVRKKTVEGGRPPDAGKGGEGQKGVTEVFFSKANAAGPGALPSFALMETEPGEPSGEAARKAPSPAAQVLGKALATAEDSMKQVIDALPEKARASVRPFRWAILAGVIALLVAVVVVAMNPTRPPPQGGVTGGDTIQP